MNTILVWTSIIIAAVLYYPLISGILREKIKQSFATWILWVSLDLIALLSILYQHGNYLLLVFYCTGGTAVTLSLVFKRQFKWTSFETFVLLLVIICLGVWALSGSKMATIASTLAVVISGLPQIRDLWLRPDKQTGYVYLGFVFANGLSFLGGKSWAIEEIFYPGAMSVLCAVVAVAAFRKTSVASTNSV